MLNCVDLVVFVGWLCLLPVGDFWCLMFGCFGVDFRILECDGGGVRWVACWIFC